MLQRVDSSALLLSSTSGNSVRVTLDVVLRDRTQKLVSRMAADEQLRSETTSTNPSSLCSGASVPSPPPTRECASPRVVPRLIDGSPLNDSQAQAFRKLEALIDRTVERGVCQTPSKDEKVHFGASMSAKVQHYFSSDFLRRYLVSRQFCEKKAYEMIMHTIHWREHHVPAEYDAPKYAPCLQSRFMEWLSHDRRGRPCLFIRSANADLSIPRETRLSFMTVALEKGITLMTEKYSKSQAVEQWNIVIDESDRGSKHTDNKFLSQVAPMLTSHYAQRLHCCYVLNPGLLTKVIFSLLTMFLDEGTTRKIKMVSAKSDKKVPGVRLVPELLTDFGAENVPTFYGGTKRVPLLDEYCAFFDSIPMPPK